MDGEETEGGKRRKVQEEGRREQEVWEDRKRAAGSEQLALIRASSVQ